jgi:putative transcriptional regulator
MTSKLSKRLRSVRAELAAFHAGDITGFKIDTLHVPDAIDVKAVRERLSLSQSQFAAMFGFNLATLQSWERVKNPRKPNRTARILLTALDRKPSAVLEALVAA